MNGADQTKRADCPVCGVKLPASCPADEGFGCPSWEEFKEAHPEYQEQIHD